MKRLAAIAMALALSSCATWYRVTEPSVRVAQAGGCTFYFAQSGLFWQPIQEAAACPSDPDVVYLTGTKAESSGAAFLGPLGTAYEIANPSLPLW